MVIFPNSFFPNKLVSIYIKQLLQVLVYPRVKPYGSNIVDADMKLSFANFIDKIGF